MDFNSSDKFEHIDCNVCFIRMVSSHKPFYEQYNIILVVNVALCPTGDAVLFDKLTQLIIIKLLSLSGFLGDW